MRISFSLTRIPLIAASEWPLFRCTEYPPRIVYDINLGVAIFTVVDHRRVQRTTDTPKGYLTVQGKDEVIKPDDLVFDGHSGAWRFAGKCDLGDKASSRIGVARKTEG